MQTFLPYPNFDASAEVLDRQRLGKQRVEALQICDALAIGTGWSHHPAVRMWKGYMPALIAYTYCVCNEWVRRGYDNTKCGEKLEFYRGQVKGEHYRKPPWVGDPAFHRGHRLRLAWKMPEHYLPLFDDVTPDDIAEEPTYVWPMEEV